MVQRAQIGASWTYFNTFNTVSTIPLPSRTIQRGSLVVVAFRYETTDVSATVTDSVGGIWQVRKKFNTNTTAGIAWSWNHPGGVNVDITVNLGANEGYRTAAAVELCGPDFTDPFEFGEIYTSGSAVAASLWVPASPGATTFLVQGNFSGTTYSAISPSVLLSLGGATYMGMSAIYPSSSAGGRQHRFSGSAGNMAGVAASFRRPGLPISRQIWVPTAASGSTGTVAVTNANDTPSASGTTTVIGTNATTNANDASSASGSVGGAVSGTVSYTNANDAGAAAGTTTVAGTSAKTNANDTAFASGVAGAVSGTVTVTNANDTIEASGTAGSAGVGSYDKKKKKVLKDIRKLNEEILSMEVPEVQEPQKIAPKKAKLKFNIQGITPYAVQQIADEEDDELMLLMY